MVFLWFILMLVIVVVFGETKSWQKSETCVNERYGYKVSFPKSWSVFSTNENQKTTSHKLLPVSCQQSQRMILGKLPELSYESRIIISVEDNISTSLENHFELFPYHALNKNKYLDNEPAWLFELDDAEYEGNIWMIVAKHKEKLFTIIFRPKDSKDIKFIIKSFQFL
jgi:hypothetical protein